MVWPFAIANGLLCAATILFAAHVREGRGDAVTLATALFVNWVLYVLSWTPLAVAPAIREMTGLPLHSSDLWLLADTCCASLAMVLAFNRWWGWGLWSLGILQVLVHGGRELSLYDFATYTQILDWVLWAQLAIFFYIGGRGVGDHLSRLFDRLAPHRGVARRASAPRTRPGARSGCQRP